MNEIQAVAKRCEECGQAIIPPLKAYYEGENVTCKGCGEVYTVAPLMGLFALLRGSGMIAKGIRFLRYLETRSSRRTKFGTEETLFFGEEDLANRYADVYNQTGGHTSWYGESVLRGRSPNLDIIIDERVLYAVSK